MADLKPDPRVYFAAERTLLAWVRTGLTVIALGFVVARFGLFLRLAARADMSQTSAITGSTIIGVGLVVLGTLSIGAAAWQQGAFISRLGADDIPERYSIRWPICFAVFLTVIGITLAMYLLVGPTFVEPLSQSNAPAAD